MSHERLAHICYTENQVPSDHHDILEHARLEMIEGDSENVESTLSDMER